MTGGVPEASVVVASFRPGRQLFECLESLSHQRTDAAYEVVVADSSGDGTAAAVRRRFPWVRVVEACSRRFPGQARNLGLGAARAPIVAFLDADCTVGPRWLQAHLDEHRRGARIVGGPVANGRPGSSVATAAWLCEFRSWVPGQPPTEVDDFPTCNLSYAREVLDEAGGFAEVAYGSDSELHWRLARRGQRIRFAPAPVAHHHSIDGLVRYLRHELRHGHDYARVRCGHHGWSPARRALYAALWPALPLAIAASSRRAFRASPEARRAARRTAPLVLAGWAAWSLGEAVGYVRGGDPRLDAASRPARPPADPPHITVVVETATDDGPALRPVLEALAGQDYPRDRFEVLVVIRRGARAAFASAVDGRPNVRLLEVDSGDYYPMKRAGGLAAQGEVVAFADADCRVAPDWLAAVGGAIADGADASVGPTRYSGRAPGADLASFISFGHVHPDRAGRANGLAANNFAVRRDVFARHPWDRRLARTGGCHLMLHTLRAAGHPIAFAPRQRTSHRYSAAGFLVQRIRAGFDAVTFMRLGTDLGLPERRFARLGPAAPVAIAAARTVRDLERLVRRRHRLAPGTALLAAAAAPGLRGIECLGGWLAMIAPGWARRRLRW